MSVCNPEQDETTERYLGDVSRASGRATGRRKRGGTWVAYRRIGKGITLSLSKNARMPSSSTVS